MYPKWAINKVQNKVIKFNWEGNGNKGVHVDNTRHQHLQQQQSNTSPRGRPSVGHMVIPYIQGWGKNIKHICTPYGIQTYFKGSRTLKQLLVRPKEQDPMEKKSGVIYSYQCGAIDCGEEYIGETSRTLGEWYKEHLRKPSPIQAHSQLTGHQLSPDNFNIIGREGQDLTRLI